MNIQNLETQYLKAKIAYYEGTPIMTDSAFDVLEKELKEAGSKVIEQVGSKRKDFDFPHPHPMRSLSKIQTESKDGVTNYMEKEFFDWFNKRESRVKAAGGESAYIHYSPKFDGSAINIIYRGPKLEAVLTRGDGKTGKDVTDRFRKYLPELFYDEELSEYNTTPLTEIRCEAVISKKIFNEKYAADFANARNYVAGVIGKDDFDVQKVSEITLVPLHFLIDGYHEDITHFTKLVKEYPIFSTSYSAIIPPREQLYITVMKNNERLREQFDLGLDGVVFSFDYAYRELLGENEHDPNWAVAIKFVPEEAVTTVIGIEWNLGKTGELCPVVLVKPVQLAGTTVKRASGYNAGYIIKNHIQPGTIVSLCKRGDIIPAIQEVIFSPE